jgi:hypothetical protein
VRDAGDCHAALELPAAIRADPRFGRVADLWFRDTLNGIFQLSQEE